jgi:hypothetical protein
MQLCRNVMTTFATPVILLTVGYRHAKGTHIGTENGPTGVQGYTARGQSIGRRRCSLLLILFCCLATVCPPSETEAGSAGTQPARDSSADGAPRVHLSAAPAHVGGPGACFLPHPLDTGVHASENPGGLGAEPPGLRPCVGLRRLIRPPFSSCSSSTRGSESFRRSSRRCCIDASSDPVMRLSSVPPGTPGSTR